MGKERYIVSVAGMMTNRFALLSQVEARDGMLYVGAAIDSADEDVYKVQADALNTFRLLVGQCWCRVSFFMQDEG